MLVADDDPRVLSALKIRLENINMDVITATDGYTALAKAVSDDPDVMILDVNMPAGDGFSVQERLENAAMRKPVPVIYLTGDSSERLDVIADGLGAVGIHHKPFDFPLLLEDLGRALRGCAA